MGSKIMRVSVAVDGTLYRNLKEIAKKEGNTVSEIIRNAIYLYIDLTKFGVNQKEVETYVNLLSGRENIVIDTETWMTILDELNKSASEEFWKVIRKIGYENGIEFKVKGLKDLKNILEFYALKRLYSLKSEGNVHSLILMTRNEQRFLKELIGGVCDALGINIEIVEGLRKLVVIEK